MDGELLLGDIEVFFSYCICDTLTLIYIYVINMFSPFTSCFKKMFYIGCSHNSELSNKIYFIIMLFKHYSHEK